MVLCGRETATKIFKDCIVQDRPSGVCHVTQVTVADAARVGESPRDQRAVDAMEAGGRLGRRARVPF